MVISKTKSNNFLLKGLIVLLSLLFLSTNAFAGTSTAVKQNGQVSANGGYTNIHYGSAKMTVTHNSGVVGLYGYAKKHSLLIDTTVHRSYAANAKQVITSFSPDASTYYAQAYGEYQSKDVTGTVTISGS